MAGVDLEIPDLLYNYKQFISYHTLPSSDRGTLCVVSSTIQKQSVATFQANGSMGSVVTVSHSGVNIDIAVHSANRSDHELEAGVECNVGTVQQWVRVGSEL